MYPPVVRDTAKEVGPAVTVLGMVAREKTLTENSLAQDFRYVWMVVCAVVV
jgi:hypothetical protein